MSEIVGVRALRVWDSRGRPTVEVEVLLDDGTSERGIAPSGKSRGSHEALELRDGTAGLGGFDVQNALREIEREIRPLLIGWDSLDQVGIDRALIALDGTPNKSRLGGNALVATSMAVLNAAPTSARQPLSRYIAGENKAQLPLPQIQIFGGGAMRVS
jgi:enolase